MSRSTASALLLVAAALVISPGPAQAGRFKTEGKLVMTSQGPGYRSTTRLVARGDLRKGKGRKVLEVTIGPKGRLVSATESRAGFAREQSVNVIWTLREGSTYTTARDRRGGGLIPAHSSEVDIRPSTPNLTTAKVTVLRRVLGSLFGGPSVVRTERIEVKPGSASVTTTTPRRFWRDRTVRETLRADGTRTREAR